MCLENELVYHSSSVYQNLLVLQIRRQLTQSSSHHFGTLKDLLKIYKIFKKCCKELWQRICVKCKRTHNKKWTAKYSNAVSFAEVAFRLRSGQQYSDLLIFSAELTFFIVEQNFSKLFSSANSCNGS